MKYGIISPDMAKNNLVIFASGAGSNALKIIEYFKSDSSTEVKLIVTNNKNAGVINHAQNHGIEWVFADNQSMADPTYLTNLLLDRNITFIVLAGYLRKIPAELVSLFPNRIVNIHPALLPKYGGKGMYGDKVHESVLANHEKESGITIHYVNAQYDEGAIIAQYKCSVEKDDTIDTLASKIHALEHQHFPKEIHLALKS